MSLKAGNEEGCGDGRVERGAIVDVHHCDQVIRGHHIMPAFISAFLLEH